MITFLKKFQINFKQLSLLSLLLIHSLLAMGRQMPDTAAQHLEDQIVRSQQDTNRVNALLNAARYLTNGTHGPLLPTLTKADGYGREALSLSRKLKFYNGEGSAYLVLLQILERKSDVRQKPKLEQQALSFFRQHPFPLQTIDAELETGNYYNEQIFNGLNQKITFYEKAVALMRKTAPGTVTLAHALRNLGNLHMYVRADEPKAILELKESLSLYQRKGKHQLQDIYGLLTGLLSDQDNYREALKYGLLAVKTIELFKDSSQTACAAYDNLGTLYFGMEDLKNAIKYHNKGLELARKTGNLVFTYDITHDLSMVYGKSRQPEKAIPNLLYALRIQTDAVDISRRCLILTDLVMAYTATRQFDLAQQRIPALLKLIDGIKDEDNIAKDNGRIIIVRFYLATRQYAKIPALLSSSRAYAERRKQTRPMANVELYSFKVDSALQHYLSAIDHYQKYKVLSDSVSKRNQDKQLAVLQIQYDTEKKNQEIAQKAENINTLTRQTQLQQTALSSQRRARNLLYGSIALLILLLSISYSRYRIKQQANYELAEQQEEINTQNESLKQLLTEREWLLKEVHHRVKNNLQIVISLLNSQTSYLKDPAMLDVLKESQHRMHSISLIHQKLYQSDNLSGIDISAYVHELLGYLSDSFGTTGKIAFVMDVDKVALDVSQAVPIGLILNEAITNSIKYAFTDQPTGKIAVVLKIVDGDRMLLRIADNGRGLPDGFDVQQLRSMGMTLMKGLSRQLGAEFTLRNEGGLCIEMKGKKAMILNAAGSV